MKNIFNILMIVACVMMYVACSDDRLSLPAPTIEQSEEVEPVTLSKLHVEGRYLKNADGQVVNLHGFAQTYSPFFNNNAWTNYDIDGCVQYNQKLIREILAAGWEVNFIRLHMDPYWSSPGAENESLAYKHFNEARFKKYLTSVFVPMAEYAIERGLYVVMRPPGVCPEQIAIDDDYHKYLLTVWEIVSQHPKLKNNPNVMFELANEPIDILGKDGTYGASNQGHYDNLKIFFQQIVDKMREHTDNIIWIPGLGYQSLYSGLGNNPIEGDNIGYAIHVYPGWMGSDGENEDGGQGTGGGYEAFQQGWDNQIKPVADIAPIMVTEMDWAPEKYNSSWGKANTGIAGEGGFGANFKYIVDNAGNVSWLIFTSPDLMAQFKDEPGIPGEYTFLNDPEACPWPAYHWFKGYTDGTIEEEGELINLAIDGVNEDNELNLIVRSNKYLVVKAIYADESSKIVSAQATYVSSNPNVISVEENGKIVTLKDGSADITITYKTSKGVSKEITITVNASTFSLTNSAFNPSIWATGTFDEKTHTLKTGAWGFGGWVYSNGIDFSGSKYLVVELGEGTDLSSGVSFRLFDENNYWSTSVAYDFEDTHRVVVELDKMYKEVDNKIVKMSPSDIYMAGFWSSGDKPIVIDNVYLANQAPGGNLSNLVVEGVGDKLNIETGKEQDLKVKATYNDGVVEIVTSRATYQSSNPEIVSIEPNGKLRALKEGTVNITVAYTGPKGDAKELVIAISSSVAVYPDFFPLTSAAVNPSIWETGTFDEKTRTLTTGQWGFGGWQSDSGFNLSKYKYLVVELGQDYPDFDVDFRLFDENNYWTSNANYPMKGKRKVVIELDNMFREVNGEMVKLDPSHLYIVGFWSPGGVGIVIDRISVTNDLEEE